MWLWKNFWIFKTYFMTFYIFRCNFFWVEDPCNELSNLMQANEDISLTIISRNFFILFSLSQQTAKTFWLYFTLVSSINLLASLEQNSPVFFSDLHSTASHKYIPLPVWMLTAIIESALASHPHKCDCSFQLFFYQ